MKKVTQEDIAKRLKITRTTVARALNDNGYVESELKQKILSTADEMGYKANLAARSLAKKGNWNIYCFLVSYNDDFARQLETGLKSAENEYLHYGFKIHILRNHPDHPDLQVENLESALKNNYVDGLIIAPMLVDNIIKVLESDARKNIPISSINLKLDDDRNLFYVGSDPFEGGRLAADLLSKLINCQGKIAVFNAFNEFEALSLRYQGFISEIEKHSRIEIVNSSYHENIEESYELAKKILRDVDDLDGMYTNTEVTCLSRALSECVRPEVKLVGNDLNDEIKEIIREGYIDMSLHSRPFLQGYLSGKYMFNYILNKVKPERDITYVGFDIVTKTNLNVDESFRFLTNS